MLYQQLRSLEVRAAPSLLTHSSTLVVATCTPGLLYYRHSLAFGMRPSCRPTTVDPAFQAQAKAAESRAAHAEAELRRERSNLQEQQASAASLSAELAQFAGGRMHVELSALMAKVQKLQAALDPATDILGAPGKRIPAGVAATQGPAMLQPQLPVQGSPINVLGARVGVPEQPAESGIDRDGMPVAAGRGGGTAQHGGQEKFPTETFNHSDAGLHGRLGREGQRDAQDVDLQPSGVGSEAVADALSSGTGSAGDRARFRDVEVLEGGAAASKGVEVEACSLQRGGGHLPLATAEAKMKVVVPLLRQISQHVASLASAAAASVSATGGQGTTAVDCSVMTTATAATGASCPAHATQDSLMPGNAQESVPPQSLAPGAVADSAAGALASQFDRESTGRQRPRSVTLASGLSPLPASSSPDSHQPGVLVLVPPTNPPRTVGTPPFVPAPAGPAHALSTQSARSFWRRCSTSGDSQDSGTGSTKGLEDLIAEVQREVTAKVSASMRFRLGLLSWFCNNLRARCHAEVLARWALCVGFFLV
jgi:hypothetical protein